MHINIKKENLILVNIDFLQRIVKYIYYDEKKPKIFKTGGEKIQTLNCIFSNSKLVFENFKAYGFLNENITLEKLKYYIMRMDNRPVIFGKKIDENILLEFIGKNDFHDEIDFFAPSKITSHNFIVIDCEMLEIQNTLYKNKNPSHVSIASNYTSDSQYKSDISTIRYVARITILDHAYKTIYDKHIIPPAKIVNFHFKHSGLMKANFSNAILLEKAQREILNIIGKNTVVLGHSVWHDLSMIKIKPEKIVDVAEIFMPHNGRYISLKDLCKIYLDREIQKKSHCSIEDCAATLELFYYAMSTRIFLHHGKITEQVSENYAEKKLNILHYSEETMQRLNNIDLSIVFFIDDDLIKYYIL